MSSPKALLYLVLFSSALAIPAYAQHGARGGHAGGAGHVGGYHGGGAVGYYGGHHYSGYYGGHYRYYGGRYYGPRVYFGFGLGYPYYGYYPYYYGYPYRYGYGPYSYGYYPYPFDYPTYSAPPVTIQLNNCNPSPPQGRSATPYRPQTPQQPQVQPSKTQEQNYYLLAFTNNLIEAARAYKVEGDQIHWIPQEGQQKQAPLSTVDVPLSRQVNRDRGVDLTIP